MIAQTARVDPELIEDMCTNTIYILAPIPAGKNGAGFGEADLISANLKNFIQQKLGAVVAVVKQQIFDL